MSVQRNYVGQGGQQAFIAELLFRGCNAAVPLVDRGLDVFAFRDDADEVARVQVKTGTADRYKRGDGYGAQFGIPLKQLEDDDQPKLFYALVARLDGAVSDVLIVPRLRLLEFWLGPWEFGTPSGDNVILTVQFRERIICGDVELTEFRSAWHLLPPFQPAGREGSRATDGLAPSS